MVDHVFTIMFSSIHLFSSSLNDVPLPIHVYCVYDSCYDRSRHNYDGKLVCPVGRPDGRGRGRLDNELTEVYLHVELLCLCLHDLVV